MRPKLVSLFRAVALVSAVSAALAQAAPAHAQSTDSTADPVNADFKGMVGMGLIGAELGFVIPAVAGARDTWAFIVFPIVGAGAGAAGGYFLLEKGSGEPELAVAVLSAGMALVVPAMVLTLAATAYDPERDAVDDVDTSVEVKIGQRQQQRARAAGPGLVRLTEEAVYVGAPAVTSGPSMDAREALRTGVQRTREVSVSVVSGRF